MIEPFEPSSQGGERPLGPDPLVGMLVADRYKILAPLGVGGMGIVYRVEHARIGKLMAMKLLAGELSRDPTVAKRFRREAELASRLSHPNTVQVFDYGQSEGLTYLVMELVTGDDLARIARHEGKLDHVRACRLALQVCGSLSEAHAAGIVHRDLKPENILVMKALDGKTELAKVCDFGLAKLRESKEASEVTSHGSVVGTPYYMAPEQIRGEDVDTRVDVYALGAVLFKLITGQPPFLGPNPMAVFAKHLTEAPRPPSADGVEVPKALDDVVLKCLAKRREDRFATIDEARDAIVSVLREGDLGSGDLLLDSGKLRQLERGGAATRGGRSTATAHEAATRDEVAAYERKLVRQRRLAQVVLLLIVGAAIAGGVHAYQLASAPRPWDGTEREPNDDASMAQEIPWNHDVTGFVGKRLSKELSDRDFYAFEVPPASPVVHLRLTALPNFATCALLYRAGQKDAIARLCSGKPAKDLDIPALRVEDGRYLVAVLQDVDPYGDEAPPVLENVSDPYTLRFAPATPDAAREIEPNDTAAQSTRVAAGAEVRGQLSFARDVDVYCPDEATRGRVRWVIRDALERPRDPGALLEAVLDQKGMREPARALVHRAGVDGKEGDGHVIGTYTSPPFAAEGAAEEGCVKLKLVLDPWVRGARFPWPGAETYAVKLERVP